MNAFYSVLIFVFSFTVSTIYLNWPQSCFCDISKRLDGKVALVTDGPSFMGIETISELARRGATILVGAQSQEHFNIVRNNVLRNYGEGGERANEDFATEEVRKNLKPIKESQVIPALLDKVTQQSWVFKLAGSYYMFDSCYGSMQI